MAFEFLFVLDLVGGAPGRFVLHLGAVFEAPWAIRMGYAMTKPAGACARLACRLFPELLD